MMMAAAALADVTKVINSWKQTNNTFLVQIQNQLQQQNLTIQDQKKLLKTKDQLLAKSNAENSMLTSQHKQLKGKLEEAKLTLSKVQKEKLEMKLSNEALHKLCTSLRSGKTYTHQPTESCTTGPPTTATLPVKNGGDSPVNATEPTVQAVKQSACPISKTEKQRSVALGGLGENVKHNDLMQHYSKFGFVAKIIMADSKSNKAKRKALVVFSGSLPKDITGPTINGTKLPNSSNTNSIASFVKELRNMKVVHYSPNAKKTDKNNSSTAKSLSNYCLTKNEQKRSVIITDESAETVDYEQLVRCYERYGSVSKVLVETYRKCKALVVFTDSAVYKRIVETEHTHGGEILLVQAGSKHPTCHFQSTRNIDVKIINYTPSMWASHNYGGGGPVTESEKQRSIFVTGFSTATKPDDLKNRFSHFGTVSKVVFAMTCKKRVLIMYDDSKSEVGLPATSQAHFDNFGKGDNVTRRDVEIVYDRSKTDAKLSSTKKSLPEFPLSEIKKQRSIIIGGEAATVSHDELLRTYSKFGTVREILVERTLQNRKKNALITYANSDARQLAARRVVCYTSQASFDSFGHGDIEIHVVYDNSSSKQTTQSQPTTKPVKEIKASTPQLTLEEQKRTILLSGWKNDNGNSSPNDLVHYFAKYGKVVNVGPSTSDPTQTFVTFDKVEERDKILSSPNHLICQNSQYTSKLVAVRSFNKPQELNSEQHTTGDVPTKTNDDTFTCQPCQFEHSVQSRVVFSPCGHGSCGNCASQLEKCHICTTVIDSKVKQFE